LPRGTDDEDGVKENNDRGVEHIFPDGVGFMMKAQIDDKGNEEDDRDS